MTVDGRGRRVSNFDAFLATAAGRSNLDVVPRAAATRVLFDDAKRAVAVEVVLDGRRVAVARATLEVLLSCGAIHSPQLLLLSGVGEFADLARARVAPRVADVRGVGRNLRDYAGTGLVLKAKRRSWDKAAASLAGLAAYGAAGAGPLAATSQEALCFDEADTCYFFQTMLFPFANYSSYEAHVERFRKNDLPDAFTIHCCATKPETGQEKGDSTSLQRGCSRSNF